MYNVLHRRTYEAFGSYSVSYGHFGYVLSRIIAWGFTFRSEEHFNYLLQTELLSMNAQAVQTIFGCTYSLEARLQKFITRKIK